MGPAATIAVGAGPPKVITSAASTPPTRHSSLRTACPVMRMHTHHPQPRPDHRHHGGRETALGGAHKHPWRLSTTTAAAAAATAPIEYCCCYHARESLASHWISSWLASSGHGFPHRVAEGLAPYLSILPLLRPHRHEVQVSEPRDRQDDAIAVAFQRLLQWRAVHRELAQRRQSSGEPVEPVQALQRVGVQVQEGQVGQLRQRLRLDLAQPFPLPLSGLALTKALGGGAGVGAVARSPGAAGWRRGPATRPSPAGGAIGTGAAPPPPQPGSAACCGRA